MEIGVAVVSEESLQRQGLQCRGICEIRSRVYRCGLEGSLQHSDL